MEDSKEDDRRCIDSSIEQLSSGGFDGTTICVDHRWSIPQLVEMACVLEAAAPKAGNVHPEASFHDTTYRDFVRSARALRRTYEINLKSCGLGEIVFQAVRDRQAVCSANTNLGIILLITPLVIGLGQLVEFESKREGLDSRRNRVRELCIDAACQTIGRVSQADSESVFKAIALCNPGGLGESPKMDVTDKDDADSNSDLMAAMRVASRWDDVAAEYVNRFEKTQWIADQLSEKIDRRKQANHQLGNSIFEVVTQVQISALARWPDTLIARKTDIETAQSVQQSAVAVAAGKMSFEQFDSMLRRDGNRLNPGTTADLIAAGLLLYLAGEAYSRERV